MRSFVSSRSRTLAAVVLLALAGGACASSEPDEEAVTPPGDPAPDATDAPASTTTMPPTTTTTTPPPPLYRMGDEAPEIAALQEWLAALGYRPGPVDGRYGPATASAVLAYQKHEGLQRDGIAGPQVLGALQEPPRGAGQRHQGAGPHIEVDLDRQIMFVTTAEGTKHVLNVSTGNNETYRHPAGYSAVAVTPTGSFAVNRKIDEEERAPLGVLYRPMYFRGGYAIHGSRSVPAYPASHGCVRVSYADEDWLFPQIPTGTPVVVYGGAGQPAPNTELPGA
jgi:peptidoglycan hydrolase-like protein with peptidoglycan-binding domain